MPLDRTSAPAASAAQPAQAHGADAAATAAAHTLPRLLVIGCGFGGLEAVRALAKHDVEIVLLDRTNHHVFQPLLYQVATAGLTAPAVAGPIRHRLRAQIQSGQLTVLQAEVTDIDAAAREVALDDGQRSSYDHLIVAAGATHSYSATTNGASTRMG